MKVVLQDYDDGDEIAVGFDPEEGLYISSKNCDVTYRVTPKNQDCFEYFLQLLAATLITLSDNPREYSFNVVRECAERFESSNAYVQTDITYGGVSVQLTCMPTGHPFGLKFVLSTEEWREGRIHPVWDEARRFGIELGNLLDSPETQAFVDGTRRRAGSDDGED